MNILFQTVNGIDQPVAFVGESSNKSQLRWSVTQLEASGIFHSCMYLQSLQRDRNEDRSSKLTICLQSNDSTVVHGIE